MEQRWTCTHMQTGDVIILPESSALELDNRLWHKEVSQPTDRASSLTEAIVEIVHDEMVKAGILCPTCGSHVPHNIFDCYRPQYKPFNSRERK